MPLSNQRSEEDQVLSNVDEVVATQREQPEVDTQQEQPEVDINTSGPLSKLPGALVLRKKTRKNRLRSKNKRVKPMVEIEGSSQRRSSKRQ